VTGVAVAPAFAGDVASGEQLFSANCAACHVGGQNIIMPEKTLEKEALDKYLAGGRKESSVVTQVTNGKNAMPAFGRRLSEEEISDLAAYVITTSEVGWGGSTSTYYTLGVSKKALDNVANTATISDAIGSEDGAPLSLTRDIGAGERIFSANCAVCHAGGQNVIMPEKTLEKEALDEYLAGGRKESSVVTQVTNGKNAMPAFGGRLSDEEIGNVAAYVINNSEAGWDE